MKPLNQHQRLIASGASHHSTEAILVYRQHWERQGFELPPFDPESRPDAPRAKPRGCGCPQREQSMNACIPGSGTVVRWLTTITGIRWLVKKYYERVNRSGASPGSDNDAS
jgi:hypothetical protein